MKNLSFLVVLLFCSAAQSQTTYSTQDTIYIKHIESALEALKNGDCKSCLEDYKTAFERSWKSALSTLRASLCAYVCDDTTLMNTYIQKAIELDAESIIPYFKWREEFSPYRYTLVEKRFNAALLPYYKEKGYNLKLMKELEIIYEEDQKYRKRLRNYKNNTPEMNAMWDTINCADSTNLIKVERIINEFGYPGISLVGDNLSGAVFLAIQHADLETQEKYLPLLKTEAEKGELAWHSLAMLIDRIEMRNKRKQIYGSQISMDSKSNIHYFYPIIDMKNVDKRRKDIGMDSLKNYGKYWDIDFDGRRSHMDKPESFQFFIAYFNLDTVFQIDRIKFPVQVGSEKISKEEWKHLDLTFKSENKTKEINPFTTIVNDGESKCQITQKGLNGYDMKRKFYFKKINDKWYFIKMKGYPKLL